LPKQIGPRPSSSPSLKRIKDGSIRIITYTQKLRLSTYCSRSKIYVRMLMVVLKQILMLIEDKVLRKEKQKMKE